jgi:aryl-alcohol dehydrogenase-like predicted oxidoreductase
MGRRDIPGRPLAMLSGAVSYKGATPARIAPAWLLPQKPWIVPIPGTPASNGSTRTSAPLEVDLAADDLAAITSAVPEITVVGERYPEAVQRMLDR